LCKNESRIRLARCYFREKTRRRGFDLFLTLILFVLVACPPLLMCAIFAVSWFSFEEDREPHPIYRQLESSFDAGQVVSLSQSEKKICA